MCALQLPLLTKKWLPREQLTRIILQLNLGVVDLVAKDAVATTSGIIVTAVVGVTFIILKVSENADVLVGRSERAAIVEVVEGARGVEEVALIEVVEGAAVVKGRALVEVVEGVAVVQLMEGAAVVKGTAVVEG